MNILSRVTDKNCEAALRSIVEPAGYRLVTCRSVSTAPAALSPAATNAVLLDCPSVNSEIVQEVGDFFAAGYSSIFIVVKDRSTEWEERAMLAGAKFMFQMPLRGQLILELLGRSQPVEEGTELLAPAGGAQPVGTPARSSPLPEIRTLHRLLRSKDANWTPFFDRIRDMLGLNRAALFTVDAQGTAMHCQYAAGVAREVYENYPLPALSGIGLLAQKHHIAFSAYSLPQTTVGMEAKRQMVGLGMHWAIPVAESGVFLGVFMVGVKATGVGLTHDDVELLFLLMEDLAGVLRDRQEIDRLRNGH